MFTARMVQDVDKYITYLPTIMTNFDANQQFDLYP